jgi:hypothetical protein
MSRALNEPVRAADCCCDEFLADPETASRPRGAMVRFLMRAYLRYRIYAANEDLIHERHELNCVRGSRLHVDKVYAEHRRKQIALHEACVARWERRIEALR